MDNIKSHNLSIFIDGGFYNALQAYYHASFDFFRFRDCIIETLLKYVKPLTLLHIFYYDCLPLANSSDVESLYKRQSYFNFLRAQLGVLVREGTVTRHGDAYIQKGVDLLIGLDIAEECNKGIVDSIVLVAGDADLLPAIRYASNRNIPVSLFHGPKGLCSDALWSAADRRMEIDGNFALKISKQYNNTDNQ